MEKSKSILLNAESFWFWPTAAIATFFPHLKTKFDKIWYIWSGHTLDLQSQLPYDEIYDLSTLEDIELKSIIEKYDLFLTAMDFEFAKKVKNYWIKTCVYDALTWYWKEIPECLSDFDLYISQDFYWVKERITSNPGKFPKSFIVPSINPTSTIDREKKYILINLWGLHNPFWKDDDVVLYAEKMINNIFNVIPNDEEVIFTATSIVAKKLKKFGVKTFSRDEIKQVLSQTKMAFMTPWLGNIYDVAYYNIPTIWLPPANDSQWQQLKILIENSICDESIDWPDLLKYFELDYKGNQQEIIKKIIFAVHNVQNDTLLSQFKGKFESVYAKKYSSTSVLIDLFWTDWEKNVAEILSTF